MITFKKLSLMLALLLTVATGAWAETEISRTQLTVPASWQQDDAFLTPDELPGFKAISEEEAASWVPSAEDLESGAYLIYGFDGDGKALLYGTLLGSAPVKIDPEKLSHFGLYNFSSINIPFYYTSSATLIGDKTEASFTSPAYDATVTYELVRDITIDVTAEVGDGTDGVRLRIQKKNDKYDLVEAGADVPVVTDNIDPQNPSELAAENYELQLQKLGDDGETWTNTADYSVGIFRLAVTGANLYEGTIYTNTFELFEGYEIEVGAGEYATYFKDENLYVEDDDAQLYTITAVSETEATATLIDVAPAGMPLLVKNNSTETKTILLIPTETLSNQSVEVAPEFKGTLEDKDLPASSEAVNYYVVDGLQFYWVKDAGTIAAHRCWLEVSGNDNARRLPIVFGQATAIENAQLAIDNDDWYDLSGRKLTAKPTKSGIYVKGGKKVVIK